MRSKVGFHARVDMSCLICSRVFLYLSAPAHSVCHESVRLALVHIA